jgi:SAM-dependent methyltransferase
MPRTAMHLRNPGPSALRAERELIEQWLPVSEARMLELGCGRAEMTRALAAAHPQARWTAMEVDAVQHARNLASERLPNLGFVEGGAQAIPAPDAAFDAVLMLKSLHHVPLDLLPTALAEVHRVLSPGGLLYVSEPVFAGAYNEVMRVFHDEERVRLTAFGALQQAVEEGLFELVTEQFFESRLRFDDFAAFEARVVGVTHTQHHLTPEQHAEVKRRFMPHQTPGGVEFLQPMRVDVLRRRDATR